METEQLGLTQGGENDNAPNDETGRFGKKAQPVNIFLAIAVGVVLVSFPLAIGFIDSTSVGKPQDMDWFQRINKPPWMPPGWVFGAVWTTLYVMMGVASFLLWFFHIRRGIDVTIPALVYAISLIFNGIWTPIFFTKGLFTLALVDLILLFITVAVCIWLFWRVHLAASILMMPYAIWLMVAFSLNIYIVIYNPDGKNQNDLPTNTTTTAAP